MKKRFLIIFLLFVAIIIIGIYFLFFRTNTSEQSSSEVSNSEIANPASVNCENVGGTLTIEKLEDGAEYGVCTFEDNRQCEEWALFRGECPLGGVKVTGYATQAARYCAISGGNYVVTGENDSIEQGTCDFPEGKQCDVWEYYRGTCNKVAP